MVNRKRIASVIAGVALSVVSLPLATTAFAAPASTAGLVSLSVQGVGGGSLSTGVSSCSFGSTTLDCAAASDCDCITGADKLVGNQGFGGGSLTFTLIVDTSNDTTATGGLTASTFGFCYPATGLGTIANSKVSQTVGINISGLACPTSAGVEVFSGAYVVSGGTGKYSTASGGAGSISGSQDGASGNSQAAVTGGLQPTAP
jgi:hypothetical protein